MRLKQKEKTYFKFSEDLDLLFRQFQDIRNYIERLTPAAISEQDLNLFILRLLFTAYLKENNFFPQIESYIIQFENCSSEKEASKLLNSLFADLSLEHARSGFSDNLFNRVSIPMPLDRKSKSLILKTLKQSYSLNRISPTIFASVLDLFLYPQNRRREGAYYTSTENIHKIIDPLFLGDLEFEFKQILNSSQCSWPEKLKEFQDKLSKITILDPACGSGCFLIESYLSLRNLEDKVLEKLNFDQTKTVRVSLSQLYGIELNPLALSVFGELEFISKTLADRKTRLLGNFEQDDFQTYLIQGNSLRIDWKSLPEADRIQYIIGNPPFVGGRLLTQEQREDMKAVFDQSWKRTGLLDYVSAWFKKAADFIKNTEKGAAFLATSSICQGVSVDILWKRLFEEGIEINFAYQSFQWKSAEKDPSIVYCVIIGFHSGHTNNLKTIYTDKTTEKVENINGYLTGLKNISIQNRKTSLCDSPPAGIGNKPIDGGNYLFSREEMEKFITKEPGSKKFFKPWYGSREFLSSKPRYCLWLGDTSDETLRTFPEILKLIEKVRLYRKHSSSKPTQKLAEFPTHFHVENFPENPYLLIPRASDNSRFYLPIGYMSPEDITSDSAIIISNASLYHFAILTSSVHMAWMRAVCGRLGEGYRYSIQIVYNNFPWPELTPEIKKLLSDSAQRILDARQLYKDIPLKKLYNNEKMPAELKEAHKRNDELVLKAYGFPLDISEVHCTELLLERYLNLSNKNPA